MCTRDTKPGPEAGENMRYETEDDMGPRMNRHARQITGSSYFRAGWTLLVIAILAIALPILATAAQPHVVWLFSTSYGAVGMVLGVTLIRVGHKAAPDGRTGPSARLVDCRP
jgi:hypothetical protein